MSLEIRNKIINILTDKKIKTVAIAMHNNPDGDAIGSAVALEKTLLRLGKNVDIILQNKVSQGYSKIIGEHRVNKTFIPNKKKYDLVILVDCSDLSRTVEDIKKMGKMMVVIDHHYGCDPIGDVYLYERAASTGIIIYKIIKKIIAIDEEIANALYLTIRSDTGSFKNGSTDAKAHEITSDLLIRGADIQLINEIYENKSLSLLKLMGQTFPYISFDSKYKIVYLVVTYDQIKRANSSYEEASMLIDYIRGAENSDIALLFIEGHDNIRIKARSKQANVSEILNCFDGGGHPTAAGAIIYDDDIYKIIELVLFQAKEQIDKIKNERVKNDGEEMVNTI